jgi:hypothetical protein
MAKYPPGQSPESRGVKQQVEDAKFLTREFGMRTQEASQLIARDGLPAEELKQAITAPDGNPILPDPLEGVPVPSAPKNELTNDADEHARKPVIHSPNNRQGAG